MQRHTTRMTNRSCHCRSYPQERLGGWPICRGPATVTSHARRKLTEAPFQALDHASANPRKMRL